MSKVLITGITGFVGSHLAELLLTENVEVCGTARWRSKSENIHHIRDKIRLIDGDIRDGVSMRAIFGIEKPDYCFHLALFPEEVMRINEVLSAVSVDDMAAQYQRTIRPRARNIVDPDVKYAVQYYKDLERFFAFVAADGLGALMNRG